jgi:hypothetical protein
LEDAVADDAISEKNPVVIVIGLPVAICGRLEQHFRGRVVIRIIVLKQDGRFQLQPQPGAACRLIERFADEALHQDSYERLLLVVLPYPSIPDVVSNTIGALVDLGASILEPSPGDKPWPSRSSRLDQKFQSELLDALTQSISEEFSTQNLADSHDHAVALELLRGLASHSKMGPNNHSHENDVWKSRGRHLGPGGRERIIKSLLGSGLLGRKQNDSAGGKGWVYWIADVEQAKALYPTLAPYLN